MSKNNNVNPGQYKVAGRERRGEQIGHDVEKARAHRLEESTAAQKPTRRAAGKAAPAPRRAK